MKNAFVLICLSFLLAGSLFAQSKVTERKILGTWKMVIPDLEKTMDKHQAKKKRSETADAGERLGEAIQNAVGEFVVTLLDDFEIEFIFSKNHKATMYLNILGEREEEILAWYINDAGGLVLVDEDEADDEVWMFEGNKLVQFERKNGKWVQDEDTYMVKVN